MLWIYRLPLAESPFTETDRLLLGFLSPVRSERILRYRQDADRRLSLCAALLTRMCLSKLSGIPPQKLQFHTTEKKKPVCLSAPRLKFSFSHTRNFILLAVTDREEVGADVERIKARARSEREIALRYFHPHERERLLRLEISCPNEAQQFFFSAWTRKEAYGKCAGTGLSEDVLATDSLSEGFSACAFTWEDRPGTESYICSVWSEELKRLTAEESGPQSVLMDEKELQNYFASLPASENDRGSAPQAFRP